MADDHYNEGTDDARADFIANDFRIKRTIDSLLSSAHAIKGDHIAGEDILARVETLRHLLREVGHDV